MSRNRLADETSPYLLQHKDNPVHWWPWGEDALAHAQVTGKPILLSVGYAACHWCHVMAHESFEDEEVAAVMNALFVNVKVDREERPDVDAIYMNALHALGQQGGWPLTMFLTPEGKPFWGGTYFPKTPQYGRQGFTHICREIERIYREEPEKVAGNAGALTSHVAPKPGAPAQGQITEPLLAEAARKISDLTDAEHGGLRGGMKFPQSPLFSFLWKAAIRYGDEGARSAVLKTLTHLCQGGIYDHLGGGFARYTVEPRWLVPHFEKMLYDNAQIVALLDQAWRETKNPLFKNRLEETVGWLMREMTVEGGGFASSLDADSEGEEGRFYVWTAAEIEAVLGKADADFFARVYDVTPEGNWEHKVILNRLQSLEMLSDEEEARLGDLRAKLFDTRTKRIRPGFDDKVLADWNGLMIAALAEAGFALQRDDWIAAAQTAFDFVRSRMVNHEGRLLHSWRAGEAKAPATASDYANMIHAACTLHGITGDAGLLAQAENWAGTLDTHYWSDDLVGYTLAADDTGDIIVRPFTGIDDAAPNPNGVMLSNLSALWLLTGKEAYRQRAGRILTGFTGEIATNLFAHTSLLAGAMDLIAPTHLVVAAPKGREDADALLAVLRKISLPGAVLQVVEDLAALPESSPAAGKPAKDGGATAYVCIGPACAPPATTPDELRQMLESWRRFSGTA